MQSIQLYIDGQRLDTFKDESISLTQSIQNVRDVSKIFTDFSKTFSVPASKTNNKIFKHYYNFDIINGFDARKRTAGEIELNYLPFRKGYIKLEGVTLKDNKAHTYKLTFFGETIELIDLFGDDELDSLEWLDNFNVSAYNANTILGTSATNGLISEGTDVTVDSVAYNDAVVVPLITHSDRLYYDSSSVSAGNNNLYFSSGTAQGVEYTQLKPAIRIHLIVKAIEQRYGITFSNDFFDTTNTDYYDLRLWLNRNKGSIYGLEDGLIIDQLDRFSGGNWSTHVSVSGKSFSILDSDGTSEDIVSAPITYATNLTLNTTSSQEYNVVVKKDGKEIFRRDKNTGTDSYFIGNLTGTGNTYTVFIEAENSFIFTSGSILFVRQNPDGTETQQSFNILQFTLADDYIVEVKAQTPKIKVIDFLTGLFKMFNLTAFKKDGVVVVKPLDEFYEDSDTTFDISEYVDVTDTEVLPALPYREIIFRYKGLNTFLADNHLDLTNEAWATENYKGADDGYFYGGDYIVELPFEHMKYERLLDVDDGADTPIQYGWYVDKNTDPKELTAKPFTGLPLLFYAVSVTDSTGISGIKSSEIKKTKYFVPSNSIEITDSECINFKAEMNEYAREVFDNTLYSRYYRKYISEIFDPQKRITKVSAFLPLRILLTYTLADKFIINGQQYKINQIVTNLESGKSELELLNVPVRITASNETTTTTTTTTTLNTYVEIDGPTTQQVNNDVTLVGEDYNFTGTTWSWTGNGAAGKTTKSITFTESSAGTKTYNVSVDGTYTDSHDITWTAAPSYSITVTGVDDVDEGDTEIYTANRDSSSTATGTETYSWTVSGGTIDSGQTSKNVTITWTSGGSKSVTCTAIQQNITASDTLNVTVTAKTLPLVVTNSYSGRGQTQVTLLGRIDNVGNPAYDRKGFYWKQGSGTPTASDNEEVVSGTGTGDYEKTITGLTAGTLYSFRAFAENPDGDFGYGITNTVTTQAAASSTTFTSTLVLSTSTDVCNQFLGEQYYHDGSAANPEVGDSVTSDQEQNNNLPNGYYLLDDDTYMYVTSGTVQSITACTTTTTTTTTTCAPSSNAYSLSYHASNAQSACSGTSTTVYGSDSVITLGTTPIFSESCLNNKAAAGFYSNGVEVHEWNGTSWTGSGQLCSL